MTLGLWILRLTEEAVYTFLLKSLQIFPGSSFSVNLTLILLVSSSQGPENGFARCRVSQGHLIIYVLTYVNRGDGCRWNENVRFFLIEYRVRKILLKNTRLLVSFIKTPVLLKVCCKNNFFIRRWWHKELYLIYCEGSTCATRKTIFILLIY